MPSELELNVLARLGELEKEVVALGKRVSSLVRKVNEVARRTPKREKKEATDAKK